MVAVMYDHDACETKIAMLEDDRDALHAELLSAYQRIEEHQNPLFFILNMLSGGGEYEFKYEPEILRTVHKR